MAPIYIQTSSLSTFVLEFFSLSQYTPLFYMLVCLNSLLAAILDFASFSNVAG